MLAYDLAGFDGVGPQTSNYSQNMRHDIEVRAPIRQVQFLINLLTAKEFKFFPVSFCQFRKVACLFFCFFLRQNFNGVLRVLGNVSRLFHDCWSVLRQRRWKFRWLEIFYAREIRNFLDFLTFCRKNSGCLPCSMFELSFTDILQCSSSFLYPTKC